MQQALASRRSAACWPAFAFLWTKRSRFLRVTMICGASGECMFSTHAALSLGAEQAGSIPRADTDHFYNCLQQERKHELNSSAVDGFGGETRMNCQQDGFCFHPGICCRSLRSGCPAQSPGIYRRSLQVRPHCAAAVPGAGPASVLEAVRCVGEGAHSSGDFRSPPSPLPK